VLDIVDARCNHEVYAQKICLTQPQIVFHILSIVSSLFAVVDMFTYVVFVYGHGKFLIFTFCTNSLNHIPY